MRMASSHWKTNHNKKGRTMKGKGKGYEGGKTSGGCMGKGKIAGAKHTPKMAKAGASKKTGK